MPRRAVAGKKADARSDLFSFGRVLYEMLTSKRAFDGASPASVIAAILERSAPSVAEVALPILDQVIKRWKRIRTSAGRSARDLKAALSLAVVSATPVSPASASSARRPVFG